MMNIPDENRKSEFTEESTTAPDNVVLDNRYAIIECIGKGGMGAVYKAYDLNLDNVIVAIKEMRTDIVDSRDLDKAVQNFKREAFTLEKLRHPALPRVSNFFCYNDKWYIVMDYIEGENLGQLMKRRGKIPEKEVLNWFYQLSDVLGYLHKQNPPIVFRDIKPSNIMITPDNKLMLIDFGIARHFKADDTSGVTSYVSFGFSPPEQYGRIHADIRSDIYALGVLLHYLLTGCDPRTANGIIIPFEQAEVRVSENFKSMIMKAVEPELNNRYQSIDDMLKAIRRNENSALSKLSGIAGSFCKSLRKPYKSIFTATVFVVLVITGITLICHIYGEFTHKNMTLDNKNVIVITYEQLSLLMSLVTEEDIDDFSGFDEADKEKLKEIAKLQGKGSTDVNIDILNNMEEKYSDISEIYLLKGNNYLLSNEYHNAIAEYEKALVIKSDTELAWNNKGLCEIYVGDYEKALESLNEAISISDQQPDTWNNLAVCHASLGNYEEAINSIDEAIKINPQLSGSYLNKGVYLYRLSRYEESLEYTEKALKLNHNSTIAHMNKGSVLSALGELELAKECYEKAIKLDKYNFMAWYNLGLDFYQANNPSEAVKCYDEALSIEPRYVPALNAKAEVLISLKKEEDALACTEKAISIDGNSAEAYAIKGTALLFLGQYDEAAEAFDLALFINENQPVALRNKAQLLLSQGNYKDALALADKATQADPAGYKSWLTTAQVYLYMGNIDDARQSLDKAKELVQGKDSKAIRLVENMINNFTENTGEFPYKVFYQIYELILNYIELKYTNTDYIEYYDNVTIYPRKGLKDDTYVVFVSYMIKINDVNTKVPSLTSFYCALTKNGKLTLQSPTDDETVEYINSLVKEDDEIKNLKLKLDKDYSEALSKDADLKAFIDKLNK